MIKKVLISSLFFIKILSANTSDSILDKTAENLSSIWEETRDLREESWNKTKDLANETWQITKQYTLKGKNIVVAEALLNTINLSLDSSTSKVKNITIEDDDKIKISIELSGESTPLNITIENYDWGVTKDKKYIVLENINYSINIGWIKHLVDFYLEIQKGYIKTSYSLSKESLFYTLKMPIKSSFELDSNYPKEFWDNQKNKKTIWTIFGKKDSINLFSDILDKQYIDIKTLKKADQKIHLIASLKDSNDIDCYMDQFKWTTDKKSLITIKNFNIDNCKKPWLSSLLKKKNNSFSFTYSEIIEDELIKIVNQN